MENKVESRKQSKVYNWYQDKKMLGLILLIVNLSFSLFAWFEIPFLTSIHSYTVGLLMGIYNPLFYLFVAYIALLLMFPEKIKFPSWFKLNEISYWIVSISIIFIGVSLSYYQGKTGYTTIGFSSWDNFSTWWDEFTSSSSAWTPENTNGGVIGVFMYSFITMIASGIGSLITAIVIMVFVISYVITGSSLGFYKQLLRKREMMVREIKTPTSTESREQTKITNTPVKTPQEKTKEVKTTQEVKKEKDEALPFDDPF